MCDICKAKFYKLANLKDHMQLHTKGPVDKFQCEECKQLYGFKRNLTAHLRRTHKFNDKKVETHMKHVKMVRVEMEEGNFNKRFIFRLEKYIHYFFFKLRFFAARKSNRNKFGY